MTDPFAAAARVPVTTLPGDAVSSPAPAVPPGVDAPRWGPALAACAAVIVDHGWLRLLGAGGHGLPPSGTPDDAERSLPTRRLIAIDVLGGTFALGAGDRVGYFAPDSLDHVALDLVGLDAFVDWALGGGLGEAFAGLRWPGWEQEAEPLAPDRGIAVHPPLWSEEGQDVARCTRGPAPLTELVAAHRDVAAQLAGVVDGESVTLEITD